MTENFIRCPACGYQAPVRTIRCPQCDYPIDLPTRGLSVNNLLALARPLPPAEAGENLFINHNCVLLQAAPAGTDILITLEHPVELGRTSLCAPGNGLELSESDALRLGVSRTHCHLEREGNQLYVTDLDSANGTFLNQARLAPQQRYVLKHGDVLTLGTLQLTVSFGLAT